jgi:fructose-1,6-bisphosphatase
VSKPSPTIILEELDDFTGRALQVCEADAVYAVTYKGEPILIRNFINIQLTYPGPKYIKSTYTSSGHAFNLAEKLNQRFNSTDFEVVLMKPSRVIREPT